ncbi:MAG TPA: DUF1361 domain-containing protein [Bacteroidia bacterium]
MSTTQLNRQKALYFLGAFAICLSIGRAIYTEQLSFLFLTWNLFLAWIPYWLINHTVKKEPRLNVKNGILILVWLAFLPNAPYLVTDFIHFHSTAKTRWLDIVLLSSYALSGILLFYFSIRKFKELFYDLIPERLQALATFTIIAASSYGIYLGRVLRFNSWDVITSPFYLVNSILRSIFNPDCFMHTAYITVLFMVFLYISVRVFDFLFYPANEEEN